MQKNIKVVICNIGEEPRVETIPNKLPYFQSVVGGYIEVIGFHTCLLVLNEEGKLMDLEPNFSIKDDVIVGNVLFCGTDGEDFSSLTSDEIEEVIEYVNEKRV
jgi:hypothetical protein